MREKALLYIEALGGPDNIREIEGCVTRLRVTVVNPARVDEAKLRQAGMIGRPLRMGTGVQVVVGTHAELIGAEINKILQGG
jgi:glucose-like phosphotransferase system IIB component